MAGPAVKLNIANRGQVFTPGHIVQYMIALMRNPKGRILEPCCGDGAFLTQLTHLTQHTQHTQHTQLCGTGNAKLTALEMQADLCQGFAHLNIDFFDYMPTKLFDTIIGNPPYVRCRDIEQATKRKLDFQRFDQRSNLYLFFIDKSIDLLADNGEMIFITPRDFMKQTSAVPLNEKLFECGSFTHFNDLGDASVFRGYTPNCVIWRWQKGLQAKRLDDGRFMDCSKGQIVFMPPARGGGSGDGSGSYGSGSYGSGSCAGDENTQTLGDLFEVKVGGASGADYIFEQANSKKSIPFVCSATHRTGVLKPMLYNTYDDCLLEFKGILLRRKIKKFQEDNWWEWGRKYCDRAGKRIYVNCKTRNKQPFFVHDVSAYDGSLLALFPKKKAAHLQDLCHFLNQLDWQKYGFQCGERLIFSQRSLQNLALSELPKSIA